MSYPAYPEYKDSGVEWLGEVPAHWELKRLRFIALLEAGQSPPAHAVHEGIEGLPFLQGNADFGLLNPAPRQSCASAPKRALPGDILFSVRAPVGAMNFADQSYGIGRGLCAIRPRGVGRNYLFYLVWATREGLHSVATGSTYEAVSASQLGDHLGVVPPASEQEKITAFLDHETARIDALVEEQQRLIALLKEKRQAVISHAMTKGLDPDVPMKGSGVEWLGEVPKHWDMTQIKHVICSLEQGWSPQCENQPVESEREWGVLKVGCVNHGRFESQENKRLPAGLSPRLDLSIKADDVLISRANTRELVGSCAVPSIPHPNLMLSDKLFRLRLRGKIVDAHFVALFFGASQTRQQIELEATGASSSMLNIGQSTVLEMPFPCPPLEEQLKIRDEAIKQTWSLLNLAEQALELKKRLEERRSALISAAVTGKIDVRGWMPPEKLQAANDAQKGHEVAAV